MSYPKAPALTETITGDDLRKGMVIVERSERGNVVSRIPVEAVGPCRTDPGNVHVYAHSTLCYARLASVEIQS